MKRTYQVEEVSYIRIRTACSKKCGEGKPVKITMNKISTIVFRHVKFSFAALFALERVY